MTLSGLASDLTTFIGRDAELDSVAALVERSRLVTLTGAAPDPFLDLLPETGVKLTPRHYSYLKISEGCNHACRFCIIPAMRGRLASRPHAAVLREAGAGSLHPQAESQPRCMAWASRSTAGSRMNPGRIRA